MQIAELGFEYSEGSFILTIAIAVAKQLLSHNKQKNHFHAEWVQQIEKEKMETKGIFLHQFYKKTTTKRTKTREHPLWFCHSSLDKTLSGDFALNQTW